MRHSSTTKCARMYCFWNCLCKSFYLSAGFTLPRCWSCWVFDLLWSLAASKSPHCRSTVPFGALSRTKSEFQSGWTQNWNNHFSTFGVKSRTVTCSGLKSAGRYSRGLRGSFSLKVRYSSGTKAYDYQDSTSSGSVVSVWLLACNRLPKFWQCGVRKPPLSLTLSWVCHTRK